MKRAHLVAQGNDDKGSKCKEDKDEEALLCLITMDDEANDSNFVQSNDELDDLYSELYDDLIKAKKSVNLSKKIIISLEKDIEKL